MPTQQEVLNDPDFQGLSDVDKEQALRHLFPDDFQSESLDKPPKRTGFLDIASGIAEESFPSPTRAKQTFDATKESAKGLTGSVLEIAKESYPAAKFALTQFPGIESGIEKVGDNVIDPVVGTGLGAINAATPHVLGMPLKIADRMGDILAESGKHLFLGKEQPADAAEQSARYLAGEEAPMYEGRKPWNTESTAVNALTQLGTDAMNNKIQTAALGAGLLRPSSIPKIADIKVPSKSVALTRTVANPPVGSKLARNWDEVATPAIKDVLQEYGKKGDEFQRFNHGAEKAQSNAGQHRNEMVQDGIKNAKTVDGGEIKQAVNELGNDPYYEFIDPDGIKAIEKVSGGINTGPMPIEKAVSIYTTIERMIRNANKKAGDAAAALENNDKYQALQAAKSNIGKQLDAQLSRTPNEWLDNSKRFSNLYKVWDRVKVAEDLYRNDPSNIFVPRDLGNLAGWSAFLKKIGLKRTAETDIKTARKIAVKSDGS
jgi:hypothetical protein